MKWVKSFFTLGFCIISIAVYCQSFEIVSYKRNAIDDQVTSLTLTVRVFNNSDKEIVLPIPVSFRMVKGFKLENITSLFFYLQPESSDILVNDEYPPSPDEEGFELPKMKKENLVFVKPKSSEIVEINTGYFSYDGVIKREATNFKVKLLYDPKLKYLDRNRNGYLASDIVDVKFHENKIESNSILIK
jgi:hypothetical protein